MSKLGNWLADALSPFLGWPLRISLALLAVYFAGLFLLTPYHWWQDLEHSPKPCVGNEVAGTIPAEFFRLSRHDFPPTSKVLLGGSVARAQSIRPTYFRANAASLLAVAGILGVVVCFSRRKVWAVGFLALCVLSSLYLSLRVSSGWDEFFLNLRHSWVLMEGGGFSANLGERLEATVDLLPFLLVAALSALLRMDLADATLAVSFSGTALCIVGAYLLVRRHVESKPAAVLAALLTTVFPPLLYVAGAGFMASVFAAMFLVSYLLLTSERKRTRIIGYGIIGLMPLVRFEAFAFILAYWALVSAGSLYDAMRKPGRDAAAIARAAVRTLGWGVGLFAPFALLCLWQWLYFGDPIAVPVVYKATPGSLLYLRVGINQFYHVAEGHAVGKVMVVLLPAIVWYLLRRPKADAAFAMALLAMSLGYYTAGGDWFPDQWARYLIPALTFLIPLSIIAAVAVLREQPTRRRIALTVLAAAIAAVLLVLPGRYDNLYRLSYISDMMNRADRWERAERLSMIGQWFRETLDPRARIASSELATMMYYAQRDLVALLGTASPYGARTPLQPLSSSPIVGKRRFPEVIERERPEVIALYEPVVTMGVDRAREDYVAAIKEHSFSPNPVNINYYLAGSPNKLMALGYRFIVVAVDRYVFAYWVSPAAYGGHLAAIRRLGAVPEGTLSYGFEVLSIHSEAYLSAGTCVRG